MYCPKCGEQLKDDSVFCSKCGLKLKGDDFITGFSKEGKGENKNLSEPNNQKKQEILTPSTNQKSPKTKTPGWAIALTLLIIVIAIAIINITFIRPNSLDSCIADAEESYHQQWKKDCKKYGVDTKKSDCKLPYDIADENETNWKRWKDDCYRRYGVE